MATDKSGVTYTPVTRDPVVHGSPVQIQGGGRGTMRDGYVVPDTKK